MQKELRLTRRMQRELMPARVELLTQQMALVLEQQERILQLVEQPVLAPGPRPWEVEQQELLVEVLNSLQTSAVESLSQRLGLPEQQISLPSSAS